ncbi:unnamed protein product [Camellia sinensis]
MRAVWGLSSETGRERQLQRCLNSSICWNVVDCIKVIATAKASEFADDLGSTSIQLEGNSLTVVNAIKEDGLSRVAFGHFVQE